MGNTRKTGVIVSYILMITEMLSSLLFTPFLIRTFGQAEYGIYSLVSTITSYMALLDLGVGNAIIRYMAKFRVLKQHDNQRGLLGIIILFYTGTGILAILIGLILHGGIENFFGKGLSADEIIRAKEMFSITMLNAAATLIFGAFNKTITAFERFVFVKITETIKIIIRVGISVLVLLLGGRGLAIVTVNFAMTVFFGMVSIVYVIFILKIVPRFHKISMSFIKEIVGFSTFVFIQMIATQINSMIDQILIGALVSNAAVILGVYAVGAQINVYFQSLSSSINGVLMPGVVRIVENGASSSQLLDEMVRIGRMVLMFLGIIWGVFLVIGDKFIILWAGEKNAQAYIVACILITPMLLTLVQSIGSQILWAKNKHKLQACLKILVAVLNIFLTVLLIKWNPLMGASIGTAISIIFGDIIVMNVVFSKYIGISMKEYYKRLFKGILPSIAITMIFGVVLRNFVNISGWISLIFNGGMMCIVYAGLMWLRGMNDYEKGFVHDILKKIGVKMH